MAFSLSFDTAGAALTTIKYFDAATNTYPTLPMEYLLWANQANWDAFKTWVTTQKADTTTAYPSTNEETNKVAYNSYSLQIKCDLSSATTKEGSGCCLLDQSEKLGGGYCLLLATGSSTVDTYYLTNSEMLATQQTDAFNTNQKVTADSDNQAGFEVFDCTGVSSSGFTCNHY